MATPVILHVRTEPYQEKDDNDYVTFDGNEVIGEVKRGKEILHTVKIITNDSVTSVCEVQDDVGLEIETWAVQHTDFMPTEDALPS